MTTPVPVHRVPASGLTAGSGAEIRHGLVSRLSAEAFGSLFIVVAGLGVPLFSIPQSSPLPAALAAGLAVTAAMLAFGYVSGGHFNPAVTVGHAVAGRIRLGDAAAYIGAQLVGGLLGALALFGILRTLPGIQDSRTAFDTVTAGFGEHSIIQAPLAGVLLLEVLGAAILVAVFLGTTARNNINKTAAAVAVGLAVAVLLQLGLSVGNAPFNPARATASALFSSSWSLEQLWLFWVAPLAGAAIAGLVFRGFAEPVAGGTALAAGGSVPDDSDADVEDFDDEDVDVDVDVADEAATVPAKAAAAVTAPPVHSAADQQDSRDEAQEFFDGKRG
ncbi:aquaporin [Pseudarthrobacter sp. AB1]|uniref:aquaporin n=1 Tax=Pseudarthrobacter sp. AB1 TaxID=2138309 RepID=UPI00186B8115|nr:aquaporin [Pseudarthrobacter sp. AB1]MBE4719657.1 porin [Pseudarthrobacter sp. AB1]